MKNFEQDNYSFTVTFEEYGQARGFESKVFKNGEENPDGQLTIVGPTNTVYVNESFTVFELQEFFRSESALKKDETRIETGTIFSPEDEADMED